MNIGLIDIDNMENAYNFNHKLNIFPNLAIMKISSFHKQKGDNVEWYGGITEYDKIYVSKVFTYPSYNDMYYKYNNNNPKWIFGGSGYDINKELPFEIEHCYPDYSLYPDIDFAMGFLTRGCLRKCPFCIVWKKEGMIRKHADLEEFWKDQDKVRLLDNNFLAYKNHKQELKKND